MKDDEAAGRIAAAVAVLALGGAPKLLRLKGGYEASPGLMYDLVAIIKDTAIEPGDLCVLQLPRSRQRTLMQVVNIDRPDGHYRVMAGSHLLQGFYRDSREIILRLKQLWPHK